MPENIVRGGTERNATTLELFFDLVYVFAITQVVGFIHHEPTAVGLAKGAFLLLLLWWTWSIYTWTTNWTGTDTAAIKLFLLATMGTTLLMATAVPDAFGESSTQFGITFFVVRLLAGGLYWVAAADYPAQRKAFYTFFPLSQAGATMILIGAFLEGPWLWGFWIAGAALDLYSAVNAGRGTWAVDAGHFAERNGLFVIIALGESVVGIGLTFAGVEHDPANVVALIVAFAGIAALWWAYFDHAAPYVEAHFKGLQGQERGRFARDAYSFLHYPLVVGIVFFAVGLEEVVTHPLDPLSEAGRVAIGLGTALVLMSIVAGVYRAVQRVAAERSIASGAVLALVWIGSSWNALMFVSVSVAATVVALSLERGHTWPEPTVTTPDAP